MGWREEFACYHERMKIKKFGTPLKPSAIKLMMLGSGELGKEVVIEAMRFGIEVIACDRYADAPAMLVEDGLRLKLGQRTFEFIDAPGHARHHHCPIDLDHRDVYAGDNFGICYREFDTAAGPFMLPTTTPVHFEPEVLHRGEFEVWRSGGVEVWCGDFFALQAQDLADCAGFYDRAALIALPPEMRLRYMQLLAEGLPSGSQGLLVTLGYDQALLPGPPFSVADAEVRQGFAGGEVQALEAAGRIHPCGEPAQSGLDQ